MSMHPCLQELWNGSPRIVQPQYEAEVFKRPPEAKSPQREAGKGSKTRRPCRTCMGREKDGGDTQARLEKH